VLQPAVHTEDPRARTPLLSSGRHAQRETTLI
jgi:hypothetical protein